MSLKLKLFSDEDIDRLIGWIPSEEFLLQWGGSGFTFPLTRQQLLAHLEGSRCEVPDHLIYKAVDADTEEVVGHGEILAIDQHNRSAVLGRILVGRPAFQGKGIGQQLVQGLLRICFGELGLHRVSLRVYDFNTAAIQCYQKVGFHHEGLQRDVHKMGDEYWSVYTMSLLEDEWEALSLKEKRSAGGPDIAGLL